MCEKDCKRVSESVSFATELLREVKTSARRWFVAFMIMVILEIATICGFLWYISLPAESSSTEIEQDAQDVENSDVRQIVGDE